MAGPGDRELEVIPLGADDESGQLRHWRPTRTGILASFSLLLGVVAILLAVMLVTSRHTVNRLSLDIRAAIADPCHWLEVSDVEVATHAPMMMTTRTNGTASEYQQGCIYTLANGPIPTVIVVVDTPRNPLYKRALKAPGGTLTLDRMTAQVTRGVVVVVQTPGALNPSGPVTRGLAAKVTERLSRPPGSN